MKKRYLVMAVLFGMLFVSVNTASAWYLEMDNADGDNEFEVYLRVEDGESIQLSYYDIGFFFDETELAYSSFTNNLPDEWEYDYLPESSGTGVMYGFQGDQAEGDPLTLTEDYLLGTYIMEILPGAVQDGANDIWFTDKSEDKYEILLRLEIDGVMYNSSSLYDGGYLSNGSGLDVGSAVPIPAAAWLLGSGLLGLAGIRGRQRSGL